MSVDVRSRLILPTLGPAGRANSGLGIKCGAQIGWAIQTEGLIHVHQTLFFDTQLVMLSAAAQRDDRSLTPPEKLKGGAAQKVAAKLIAASFVKEVKAKAVNPEDDGALWFPGT